MSQPKRPCEVGDVQPRILICTSHKSLSSLANDTAFIIRFGAIRMKPNFISAFPCFTSFAFSSHSARGFIRAAFCDPPSSISYNDLAALILCKRYVLLDCPLGVLDLKEAGRLKDVGWALLPVGGDPVGQEWPTFD